MYGCHYQSRQAPFHFPPSPPIPSTWEHILLDVRVLGDWSIQGNACYGSHAPPRGWTPHAFITDLTIANHDYHMRQVHPLAFLSFPSIQTRHGNSTAQLQVGKKRNQVFLVSLEIGRNRNICFQPSLLLTLRLVALD